VGIAAGGSAGSVSGAAHHTWLQEEHLQLTRVQELLGQRGLHVPYTTLDASSGAWATDRVVVGAGIRAHGADAARRGG
jgi:hypothetical protein